MGGSTEASTLGRAVASRADLAPVLSLAGRTAHPVLPPIPHRIGGFGGVDGLARFLATEHIAAVVDATHPFAATISRHAVEACGRAGVPLAAYTRPPWVAEADDAWRHVPSIDDAVRALGPVPKRVFLTTGRLEVAAFKAAPQHDYLIRTIDPPPAEDRPPQHRLILARPPFGIEAEAALMRAERIDVLVTKNSGGVEGAAKLVAARRLGCPVILVERPPLPPRCEFVDLEPLLDWIEAQRPCP